jgi:major membrane immunogen (membrane-anchored lipoprotein)
MEVSMKRFGFVAVMVALGVSLSAQTLKDGKYFAEQDGFGSSGWKSQVVLEVKGGKITAANWNGVSNIAGAADKKAYDKAGKYNMVKFGKAQAEWYQQAEKVEQYLVKTQDYKFNKYSDAEGHTDAISGASIHVKEFFDLAQKAIAAGPVAKGLYAKDGWYYAEQPDFDKDSGWKETVLITVVNGRIVDVVWNGISKDSAKKSKIVESASGNYGMVKFGKAQAEWHEQAAKAEAALINAQDPAKIAVKADGKTDAISGVSIHVGSFLQLATTALKAAK